MLPSGSPGSAGVVRRPAPHPQGEGPEVIVISALTGEGIPTLLKAIEDRVAAANRVFRVELAGADLRHLHRLYELGEVLGRTDTDEGATVAEVRVGKDAVDRFRKAFPDAQPAR